MSDRYYSVDYGDEYYIFDSNIIKKEDVLEEMEYDYIVFSQALTSEEIIRLLNNQVDAVKLIKESIADVLDNKKYVPLDKLKKAQYLLGGFWEWL